MYRIRNVRDADVERVRGFLEGHVETSVFLLSNLAEHGTRLGEAPNSGNVRFVEDEGGVVAVGCLTRRGIFLVQAGQRHELAPDLLSACQADPVRVTGVIGEWNAAQSAWAALCREPGFEVLNATRERLYELAIARRSEVASAPGVRPLVAGDAEQWLELNTSYLRDEELPVHGTDEQRRAAFERQVASRHWWGAFDGERLVSIAGLNAAYGRLGQVGGVYTPPEQRRKGLARSVMNALVADAKDVLGLDRLILFTGERNAAARALYESMGFAPIGHFALLFGSWAD